MGRRTTLIKATLLILSISSRILPTHNHIHCSNSAKNTLSDRAKPNGERYGITIEGDPDGYTPGEKYTIYLRNDPKRLHDFYRFFLTVESNSGNYGTLTTNDLTSFSQYCPNTIVESNLMPKREVQVTWEAPTEGEDCVTFKATVIVSKEYWYSEDGPLTKVICISPTKNAEVQPEVLEECCACQEAKYEVTFEGMWTRNVFPKEFPANEWSTRFSDVVGASHSNIYSVWNYEQVADEGLKVLSEQGNTKVLEDKIKQIGTPIRTIIKARGLTYPNTNGKTYAVFRVDKDRHLVSLVSSIIPSPDWFVGVSNYELCTPNCTWIESAEFHLYPIDAGTDGGKSYTCYDEPLETPKPIKRIANDDDDDSTSFYNPDGGKIPPIAKLHLTRQKLFDKDCAQEDGENCGEWTDWSSCSVTCGYGVQNRYRQKKDEAGDECKKTIDERPCGGEFEECRVLTDAECAVTSFSKWSSCSASCGRGTKTRDRQYVNPKAHRGCEARPNNQIELVENQDCFEGPCPNGKNHENCAVQWGDWEPCSVTCGEGIKVRVREPSDPLSPECDDIPDKETVVCYQGSCDSGFQQQGLSSDSLRHYDYQPVQDCQVERWSKWSPCEPHNGICGPGIQKRSRRILIHASNGGRACPTLYKTRPCLKKCPSGKRSLEREEESSFESTLPCWGPCVKNSDIVIDCEMSDWSEWTQCSQSCSPGAVKIRTRSVVTPPSSSGTQCSHRIETEDCNIPIAC